MECCPYMYGYLCSVQNYLGVIRCTVFKMTCYSNPAKLTEIWNSGVLVTHISGSFDFVVFTATWGHSLHVSQSDL